MQIGMIGLGKMGFNLAQNLKDHGHEVIGHDVNDAVVEEFIKMEGIQGAHSLEELTQKLTGRRVIWLMVPAGTITQSVIDQLVPMLNENDIIIDGGNSRYTDTLLRYRTFEGKGNRLPGLRHERRHGRRAPRCLHHDRRRRSGICAL